MFYYLADLVRFAHELFHSLMQILQQGEQGPLLTDILRNGCPLLTVILREANECIGIVITCKRPKDLYIRNGILSIRFFGRLYDYRRLNNSIAYPQNDDTRVAFANRLNHDCL